jgi:hypothetical protein
MKPCFRRNVVVWYSACRLERQTRKQTASEDDGRGVSFECRVHGLFQEIETDGRIGASDSMRFSGCRDVDVGIRERGKHQTEGSWPFATAAICTLNVHELELAFEACTTGDG